MPACKIVVNDKSVNGNREDGSGVVTELYIFKLMFSNA